MWFFSEFISVFYLVLYWNRKHGLNCHRMKPALFSVLCEIKEKTGKIFSSKKYYNMNREKNKTGASTQQHADIFTSQWPDGSLHPGYKGPLPKLINHFSFFFKYVNVPHSNSPVVTAESRFWLKMLLFLQEHLFQHWLLGFKQKVRSSLHPHYPGTEQDGEIP